MQFRLIVVSIFLKTCVKDRGSTLLISCKAVKRGLQFAIFFVNFVLTNGTVSYYSRYCLQVIIVLIHVYNWEIRHHSTVCRCGLVYIYIYIFFLFFFYWIYAFIAKQLSAGSPEPNISGSGHATLMLFM